MKNLLKIIGVLVLAFVGYVAYIVINPVSPKETVSYSSEISNLEVVYSRPYKKDRLIFEGYPRSLSQAKNLENLLKKTDQKIDFIFSFILFTIKDINDFFGLDCISKTLYSNASKIEMSDFTKLLLIV